MKKFLVVLVILAITVFAVSAATIGNGTLNVNGKIGSGNVSFVVAQTNSDIIDLKNNTAMQIDGDGVVLGKWDFNAVNQGAAVDYTVTYSNTPLTSSVWTDLENEIPYEVIELDGTTAEDQTESATEWQAPIGSSTRTRNIAVRLTGTVPSEAPAATNYTGSITITLTTGS